MAEQPGPDLNRTVERALSGDIAAQAVITSAIESGKLAKQGIARALPEKRK